MVDSTGRVRLLILIMRIAFGVDFESMVLISITILCFVFRLISCDGLEILTMLVLGMLVIRCMMRILIVLLL